MTRDEADVDVRYMVRLHCNGHLQLAIMKSLEMILFLNLFKHLLFRRAGVSRIGVKSEKDPNWSNWSMT